MSAIADLLRAQAALAPADDRTRAAIAHALGFAELSESTPVPVENAPPDAPRRSAPPPRPESTAPERERLAPVGFEVPAGGEPFWRGAEPPPEAPPDLRPILFHAPLLPPRRSRALLAAGLATREAEGPVDLESLVEKLARAHPVPELPRRSWLSLRRGVQVLVDIGEGMEPFARDQQEVAGRMRRLAGRTVVRELAFRRCPVRGAGEGPVWTWGDYETPPAGTPVLLLSDLGIGGPVLAADRSTPGEWRTFVERVRAKRCPVVALVPFPARRWPGWVSRSFAAVVWDRGAGLGDVRRALERVRRWSG